MLGNRKWLSMTLAVALATVGLGASAAADSGSEQGFLSAINSSRSSAGLAPLSMDGGLQSHARAHTQDMIGAGEIYHSTSGELQTAAGGGWSKLGENVGRGGTVSSLHDKFMSSPGHKANILGDYNYVGIGTDSSSGLLYVTVVFMKKGATSSPSPATTSAPMTPTTTKAPAPTTTTTTLPPTTTTTLIVGPDKPVTPGESCFAATRFGWLCHD
jgi:hypothetical protein